MSSPLIPPGSTEDVQARSALVLAPHYDDEVLGCGGLVAKLARAGAAVRVLFLSDGGALPGAPAEERRDYSRRRRAEARAALEVLGASGSEHLELPDGGLGNHLDEIAAAVRKALLSLRPELLLVTSPLEVSVDHRATFRALHRLLSGVRKGDELEPVLEGLRVLAYDVNFPLYPDLLVDVGGEVETVERAMACYPSQQERHDYLGAYLGLARYRTHTLPPGVTHAEGYRRLTLGDFTTRSLSALVAELGGAPERLEVREGPAISVIVRTKDRPELLAEALASLAESTYRRAGVILVNDGGAPPEVPADFPFPVERIDLDPSRGRAAAANAGLAAARGDYVAFLDDDDLAFPEHLETLAGLVSAEGVRVAYTDAAVGVYELGSEGWRCRERRLTYSRDFDADLLLVDNYIPFNTLLIERRLAREVGELDPGLPFFEDWDFLIRLASRTPFHHLPRVTCEYRQFRGGGHHILGDAPRQRSDFLAMKARVVAKHRDRLTPELAARVVDRLRGETVAAGEDLARLRAELERSESRAARLNGRVDSLETHQKALEEFEERAREEIEGLRRIEREQAVMMREQEKLLHERQRILEDQETILQEQGPLLEERQRIISEQEQILQEQGPLLEERQQIVDDQLRVIAEQDQAMRSLRTEIERLRSLVRAMEATRAWRAHDWWQRQKQRLRPRSGPEGAAP